MKKKKLDLLYEDKNLLIVSKPSKLLTVGTEKEKIIRYIRKLVLMLKNSILRIKSLL